MPHLYVVARLVALTLVIANAGCGPDAPPPIIAKELPKDKDSTKSPRQCEGVDKRGFCDKENTVAVYCDVEAEEVRRIDCAAMQRECVVNKHRGAVCEGAVGETDDMPYDGKCDGNVAKWIDFAEEEETINTWDCDKDGLTCKIDDCSAGAWCCGAGTGSGGGTDGGPVDDECMGLDFYGECSADGTVARWCDELGQLRVLECDFGEECIEDVCAEGAFCCDPISSNMEYTCEQVNYEYGICVGNTLYYCTTATGGDGTMDNIVEEDCGTSSCEVDTCFVGYAECCE